MILVPELASADRAALKMAAKAALMGGMLSDSEFVMPGMPWCDEPVHVGLRIRAGGLVRSLEASGHFPCRKCAKCRQYKQMHWRQRVINELNNTSLFGGRSWFMTLTFAPAHLAGVLVEAKSRRETDVERAAYQHVQTYFKRLRKSGARFRYVAIFERGEETGRAHYHLCLHESGNKPIVKRLLQGKWRSFSHCRLVKSGEDGHGSASYITKYLTKNLTRPRASKSYGREIQTPDKQAYLQTTAGRA